jgi:hypothetical protein
MTSPAEGNGGPGGGGRGWWRRQSEAVKIAILTAIAIIVAAAVSGIFAIIVGVISSDGGSETPAPGEKPTAAPSSNSSYPVSGDDSAFVRDVTIPDGTPVAIGQKFLKTWEIRNTGSVFWHDRYLTRQGKTQGPDVCTSDLRVPIPDTAPGHIAEISVWVTAPSTPALCHVEWKMTDINGHLMFPGKSGIFFEVNVTNG